MTTRDLALNLEKEKLVRFGTFVLKSGKVSPFYIDLRDTVSKPDLFRNMTDLLLEKIRGLDFDVVTGIPYTALPYAAVVAERLGKPLIYRRKEEKAYGLGGEIVGSFKPGDRCLVIDDLVTTGESKIETTRAFEAAGLRVCDFVVFIDRSLRAAEDLAARGYRLHSLVSLEEILDILTREGRIAPDQAEQARLFTRQLGDSQGDAPVHNPYAAKLAALMARKKTNLVLSLDATNCGDFFRLLESAAPEIAVVKVHVDILDDFDPSFPERLSSLAREGDFHILADRKFADIGNTVRLQYRGGIYRIARWADAVTVHMISGNGVLQGLFGEDEKAGPAPGIRPETGPRRETGTGRPAGSAFLLARMSTEGNYITESYTRRVVEAGRAHPRWVAGYIGHGDNREDLARFREKLPPGQLLLMPGVQLQAGKDGLGQRYMGLDEAVRGGADGVIVGRGIYGDADPAAAAKRYREIGWRALEARGGIRVPPPSSAGS